MTDKSLSRRDFLKIVGGSSVGIVLASCTVQPAAPAQPAAEEAGAAAAPAEAPETTSSEAAPAAEAVTLSFWHPFGGSRVPLVEKMANDFHAENPDITIEQVLWVAGTTGTLEKFIGAVAAGTPPDLIMFHSRDLPSYVAEGVFEPLDPFIEAAGLNPDEIFYAGEIGARRVDGVTYLLPTVTATAQYLCYYSVARFEEQGMDPNQPLPTWEEWEAALPKFVDLETDPPKWFAQVDYNVENLLFVPWLYLNGGKWVSDDLTKVAFNDDVGLQALQWMKDMTDKQIEYSLTRTSSEWQKNADAQRKVFANGQKAIHVEGTWLFNMFPAEYGMDMDKFRVHSLPYHAANAGAHVGVPTPGGWGNGMPKGGKSAEAGFKFVQFSTTTPASLEFTLEQARPNPVREYNADQRYYDANPYWDNVIKILEEDYAIPPTAAWPEVNQILIDMTDVVLYGEKAPEQAIEEAATTAQRALDKAQG